MKRNLQVLLAATLVLIGGFFLYTVVFAPDQAVGMTLLQVDGEVWRANPEGHRAMAAAGDVIAARESVKVEGEGSAVLAIGDDTRLTVGASSSLKVLDVDASGVRVELEGGRVSARVRPGSPTLDIANRGRSLRASDADFQVVVDEEGALAVEASRGSVALTGFEGATAVGEGERLRAMPDQPAVVADIPASLLLHVRWPEQRAFQSEAIPLTGQTDPYAHVRIGVGRGSAGAGGGSEGGAEDGWATVRAGPDGSFEAVVQLEEGENPVEVRVRDVAGNEQEDAVVLTRERSTAQPFGSGVEY